MAFMHGFCFFGLFVFGKVPLGPSPPLRFSELDIFFVHQYFVFRSTGGPSRKLY